MKIKKILNKTLVVMIVIVSGFLVFIFGFQYGYKQIPEPPEGLPKGVDVSLLWDVWQRIEEKYPGEIDYQQMIFGAAMGLVEGLGDPHTTFFPPEESRIFRENISGAFQGVGMEIGIRKGSLTVIAPLEGTPAQRAGLLSGDKIIKIEDIYTRDITVQRAVKLIRGEKGTKINLAILREGWDKTKNFEIIRDVIKIPSVGLEILEEGIAKIAIHHFSGNLNFEFGEIADRIINDDSIEKIILDLRNNPGGLLNKAKSIAGWFLENGKIVTIQSFGADKEQEKYLARGNELLKDYPIVVLINQGSASGAEILAAALRDNRDGVKLVGEVSFGKGSVQEPVQIRGGSLLKITIAHWLTPKGELISDIGLKPDIIVELTEEDYKEEKDSQVEEAIRILKAI